jgi:RND family efflux transporter MFP subunit
MAKRSNLICCCGWAVIMLLLTHGCNRGSMPKVELRPQEVTVSTPKQLEVTDTYYFEGYTAAVESVEVYSQVNGYLSKIYFQDGADVKQGDPLFLIDPRPFQAVYDQAAAEVNRVQKTLDRLTKDLNRAEQLLPKRTISQEEYDRVFAEHASAMAELTSRKAALETANLNLHFAAIKSPIAGRISRRLVTVGNLVTANTTLLATIVSLKPIYVYFDVDEPTVLKVRQGIREGKVTSIRQVQAPVYVGLDIDKDYPYEGVLDFVDPSIDPKTGTLKVRGVFPNTDDALSPGMHARVKMPIGKPYQALAIPDRAIGTNQGRKIVYVVDAQNQVRERPVTLGPLEGELRVITDGIGPEDRVIVNGLQRVRDGVTVDPKTVEEMSTRTVAASTPQPSAKPAASAPVAPSEKSPSPAQNPPANDQPPAKNQQKGKG